MGKQGASRDVLTMSRQFMVAVTLDEARRQSP
jgi:hypothetical protein